MEMRVVQQGEERQKLPFTFVSRKDIRQ